MEINSTQTLNKIKKPHPKNNDHNAQHTEHGLKGQSNTLQKNIERAAASLNMDEDTLKVWLKERLFIEPSVLLSFLHQIVQYKLNPLSGEIALINLEDGRHQSMITIDGWCKLINAHSQFAGMTFRESTVLQDGIPAWIECCIYRHDRILPITIKEYYEEIKTEHAIWKNMPRRMLRHRTIQQCARIAFGIQYTDSENLLNHKSAEINTNEQQTEALPITKSRKEWLKERLSINIID